MTHPTEDVGTDELLERDLKVFQAFVETLDDNEAVTVESGSAMHDVFRTVLRLARSRAATREEK